MYFYSEFYSKTTVTVNIIDANIIEKMDHKRLNYYEY